MASNPIRLGIVGLGRAGWGGHCRELRGRERKFRIVAACDVLQDRLDKAAAAYGCKTYAHTEDLIADPDVEMVDLTTRSSDHFRQAMLALNAGKLVYVEKPMCTTYAEAKKLRAAAKGRLFVAHSLRFEPEFQHVREIIRSGILGDVYDIKLRRWTYWRRDDWQMLLEYGGGQLLNWGVMIVDHALQFLDGPVTSIWSDLKRIAAEGDAEDFVKIILEGENGIVVDIEVNGGAALGEPEYTVLGTKGALICTDRKIHLRYLDRRQKRRPRPPRAETLAQEDYGKNDKLKWVEKTIPVKHKRDWDTEAIWNHLYAAVRKGAPFPIALDEVVEIMRIVSETKKGTPFESGRTVAR